MASVPALTDLTVADLWKEVKDPATLWGDVSRETLRAVKLLLQNRMHEELTDYLHAGRYTRNYRRRGHRQWGLRAPPRHHLGHRPMLLEMSSWEDEQGTISLTQREHHRLPILSRVREGVLRAGEAPSRSARKPPLRFQPPFVLTTEITDSRKEL